MTTSEDIRDYVQPVVAARGLDLYDVELAGTVLRVLVDRSGGVDVDALGDVTRALSRVLDERDPIPSRYTLEVSSPGLERRLRRPEHFQRSVGSRVVVKTVAGTEGDRRVEGQLTVADDDGIVVTADDGSQRRLAYVEIDRARTVFEWGPAPKPGSPQTRKKRAAKS